MEAKIAEITKRNMLFRARNRCEVCGISLGYAKEDTAPQFHYITPPFQGGTNQLFNIVVLCPDDALRIEELSKEELTEKAKLRENFYSHS